MPDWELLQRLRVEEREPFEGWDFSHLEGRMHEESPSWNYGCIVRKTLSGCDSLLDMGTGGGEFLSELAPLPADTHATEGYAPNVPVAQAKLEPLGVRVHEIGDDRLPLSDESFDLVINRHESYDPAEVRRVLRPGGRFITQQVGGRNDLDLNELLAAPNPDFGMSHWDLPCARMELEAVGFAVIEAAQEFPLTRFSDVDAIVLYLKSVPWQIPDFAVDLYLDRLKMLENRIRNEGSIAIRGHRFFLVSEK
ncbi:MAG: class I SAM-dependent methyltransferase [Rubrobacter sp.]|nr:class I SAM-dependent methyltransferase [Rubrobacter sp.]